MTTAAWILMVTTWTIITITTSYFFIRVVRTPQKKSK